MTSQNLNPCRRNTVLGTVVGVVLASYAGGACALEFETDDGTRVIWNTTVSAGSSWRAEEASPYLYTKANASLIGLDSGPIPAGTAPRPGDGLAGNQADSGTLNYDKGDRFSTPFKLLTDIEIRKGDFGLLLRGKAWYDDALENGNVRLGNQPNNYNGVRPGLGPQSTGTFIPPLDGNWPRDSLSDAGFEKEQKFSNAMLLDAYVYGSFGIGDTDLQLRLGRPGGQLGREHLHPGRQPDQPDRRARPRAGPGPSSRKYCCRSRWPTRTGASASARWKRSTSSSGTTPRSIPAAPTGP